MGKTSIEVIRRVIDEEHGVFLEVGPDREGLGAIEVITVGNGNEEWFGKIHLTLSKDMTKALGEALIAAAGEVK